MAQHLRTFEDFMSTSAVFYKTIGVDIFDYRPTKSKFGIFLKCLLFLGFINFNFNFVGAVISIIISLQSMESFFASISIVSCVAFALTSNIKQLTLAWKRKVIQDYFDKIENIFPNTSQKQKLYRLSYYEGIMRWIMIFVALFSMAYTTTFCMYPLFKSFVEYFFLGAEKFELRLGFLIWYPYDTTRQTWVYFLTFLTQAHSSYFGGVSFVCADFLLINTLSQLIMHFDYIARELENYGPDEKNEKLDLKFLESIIEHQNVCLELGEHVNQIFSFSLLLNFMTTSLTICFIGFQVTTSSLEVIIMYCIFLVASMLQVFIVCYYGDELMTASQKVGIAAYNQNWFNASIRYKKMLVLIMCRSQRPSSITPPTFSAVGFETYMKVISMSYRFFALLRSTYYGN